MTNSGTRYGLGQMQGLFACIRILDRSTRADAVSQGMRMKKSRVD